LPPRVAPAHVVILPVTPKEETRAAVLDAVDKLAAQLREQKFAGTAIRVEVDRRDIGGGTKTWDWIKKGAPVRVEIGPRDLEKGTLAVARRDRPHKEKTFPTLSDFVTSAPALLQEIQDGLLARADAFRRQHTVEIDSKDEFYRFFTAKNPEKPEIHGGFALAHWNGSAEVEEKIKADLKVTIRCIPFDKSGGPGKCVITGEPSAQRVVFAKSY